MSYYYSCKICGASLDPGEHCDCDKDSRDTQENSNPDKREDEKECKKTA